MTTRASATALASIQTDTDDIQTRLPATLDAGNIRASIQALAADSITAAALASDAVTEIQTGLSTSAALTTAQTDLTTLTGRLTSGRAAGLDNLDTAVSSRAPSSTAVSTAVFTPTRQALVDNLDGTITSRASAASVAAVQTDTDDIQGRLPATLDGGNMRTSIQAFASGVLISIVDAIFALVTEPDEDVKSRTFLQQWRILWSVIGGKRADNLKINTAKTENYKDPANAKNRATFALATNGTRVRTDQDGDL